MNTYYPEPPSSFENLTFSAEGSTITGKGNSSTIEVSYIANVGWCIEARYDLHINNFRRQPFTGLQDTLALQPLTLIEDKGDSALIETESSSLTMNKNDASFVISANNKLRVSTVKHPFSLHREPVKIFEKLMSLKVTDFTDRAPFAPKGELFESHMVRFQYTRPEGIVLGIPGQAGEFNRNGYRFELYNTDDYLHLPLRNPLYQSWPILIHRDESKVGWVCVFHDNPSRTFIDVGEFYEDRVTFESLVSNSRVYILNGDSLEDISVKLSTLLGQPSLLPLWSYGYQQCRFSYMNTQQLRDVVKQMNAHDIPLDTLYCDIDYMDGFRVFTKDPNTFADLPEYIQEMKDKHMHTMCIIDPGVKVDDAYEIYTDLKATGKYLKTEDGNDFEAMVWPGRCILPDFGDPEARVFWANKQTKWLQEHPFDGVWNDMNEPSNFDEANKKTATAYTSRGSIKPEYNLYGYFMSQASSDGWRQYAPDRRGLIITRSGYPGVQRYAVIWHGDNISWWEHLKLAMHTAISYSLCGAPYTGADIPGFTGNPPDDLAVRFFQLGSFLPFFRGHSIYFAKDKEPYSFSKETVAIIRDIIKQRYSLLREWYSGFEHAIRTKNSPLKPVFTVDGKLLTDQFLLFDKFLIAPILERNQVKRLVYLPEGDWYMLGNTTIPIAGDQWLTHDVDITSLYIFVKAGNIITRNEAKNTTFDTINAPESYEVYPDLDGYAEGYWYNDDGMQTNPKDAKHMKLELDEDKKTVKKTVIDVTLV